MEQLSLLDTDDASMVGAYLEDGASAEALIRVLEDWFHQTSHVPAAGAIPEHVVAWDPRPGSLTRRHRALIALSGYDAGARELWLLTDDGEVLLPRLLVAPDGGRLAKTVD